MTLKADFKEFFPEFDDTTVEAYWPRVEDSWPCLYNCAYAKDTCAGTAILWLCGHLMATFSDGSGSGGAFKSISNASVGNVSVGYGTPGGMVSDNMAFFGSTMYGRMFLKITAQSIGAVSA